jgi:hypothetical protein
MFMVVGNPAGLVNRAGFSFARDLRQLADRPPPGRFRVASKISSYANSSDSKVEQVTLPITKLVK